MSLVIQVYAHVHSIPGLACLFSQKSHKAMSPSIPYLIFWSKLEIFFKIFVKPTFRPCSCSPGLWHRKASGGPGFKSEQIKVTIHYYMPEKNIFLVTQSL
jgi:hypothetical protein